MHLKSKIKSYKSKILEKAHTFKQIYFNSYYYSRYYNGKVDSKVVLIESRAGDDLAGNMYRIAKEMVARNYRVYISFKASNEKKIKSIVVSRGLKGVKLVRMFSRLHYKLMATAKYLFNDVVFDWKFIKKDGQIYVNTWHGTPLKKLGYDVSGDEYIMGNGQRNLLMCDYIVAPNDYCVDHLLGSYYIQNLYHGKILYSGYPRNEVFFNSDMCNKIRKELNVASKYIFAYMPTWRGSHDSAQSSNNIKTFLAAIDKQLKENQIFYVKLHPMEHGSIDFGKLKNIRPFPTEYETYDFLNCVDCLITDYSSVFFDFSNTHKKIILYVPDKKKYLSDRGLYLSIDELPFPITYTIDELLVEMNTNDFKPYPEFTDTFCKYDRPDSTKQLLDHLIFGHSVCIEESVKSNEKKNIALYSSNLQMKNGIVTAYFSLLNHIDTSKYNFYLTFFRKTTNRSCRFFDRKPENVGIFSISSDFFFTFKEKIAYDLQQKKNKNSKWIKRTLERMYRREVEKLFVDAPFDALVHFEGYGTNNTIPIFQRYPKSKVIFVHNDMMHEINVKHNQNPTILRDAYTHYDKVAVVSPDLIEPTVKVGAPRKKIFIVNNLHDYENILARGSFPIEFQKDTECTTYNPGGIERVLSSRGKKFITIGRFSPEKGHRRLLSAFDKFCNDYPETQLIIIGGYGNQYNNTLKWTRNLRHWRNVTIIKSIVNPMPILKRCDLFILSSFYEGLGLVIAEADILGIPSLSTNIVGPRTFMTQHYGTLVEDSEQGILRGMYSFMNGFVTTLKIDYSRCNQYALEEFESLLTEGR